MMMMSGMGGMSGSGSGSMGMMNMPMDSMNMGANMGGQAMGQMQMAPMQAAPMQMAPMGGQMNGMYGGWGSMQGHTGYSADAVAVAANAHGAAAGTHAASAGLLGGGDLTSLLTGLLNFAISAFVILLVVAVFVAAAVYLKRLLFDGSGNLAGLTTPNVKVACTKCGTILNTGWNNCPACGQARVSVQPQFSEPQTA